MKKIGLVMCFKHRNYGSMLQSFALQQFFRRSNIPFECVNYEPLEKFPLSLNKIPLLFIGAARKMKLRTIKRNLTFKYLLSKHDKQKICSRQQAFDNFSKKNFELSATFKNREELHEASLNYASVVLGSDQVLHPINLGSHFYDLSWVDDCVAKYAYASSFGVSYIPLIQRKATKRYLSRFNRISTRELNGAKIVESVTNKLCNVCLDPTLLFTANQWNEFLNTERIIEGDYIFCYFLGKSKYTRDFANQLKKRTGKKIVAIPHLDEYIKEDNQFGDLRLYDVSPENFISLIRFASYVCTDSFHGTVFSILNKKKFATFPRYSSKSKASANSRILGLFDILDLRDHFFSENDSVEKLVNQEMNFDLCEKKIASERESSISFLNEICQNEHIDN